MKHAILPFLAMALSATTADAQLAVAISDGKQLRRGEAPASRTPDMISVLDLSRFPPRVIGSVEAPVSMIGPPTSVAVAPDESFAIITAAQALDGGEIVKNGGVSVIDLSAPSTPRVVQSLEAGPGASGVSINRAGTLALVASTGDDSISVFAIRNRRLTPVGSVRLSYESRPTDVVISPDGRSALAVAQSGNRLVRLSIDGTRVTRSGIEIEPGRAPYGITISRDGRFAFNTNLGGRIDRPDGDPRTGSIAVIDMVSNNVASSIDVGVTPEHVALSPDGAYLAVVLINGSNGSESSPSFNPFGLLKILKVQDGGLVPVAETRTGAWCQGAAWSGDGETLLLQCATAREIEVYRFDGRGLVRERDATLRFEGRPGAIATAQSR